MDTYKRNKRRVKGIRILVGTVVISTLALAVGGLIYYSDNSEPQPVVYELPPANKIQRVFDHPGSLFTDAGPNSGSESGLEPLPPPTSDAGPDPGSESRGPLESPTSDTSPNSGLEPLVQPNNPATPPNPGDDNSPLEVLVGEPSTSTVSSIDEITQNYFGKKHLATQIALNLEKFLPNLTFGDFEPPEDMSIEFVSGIDRDNTDYIM